MYADCREVVGVVCVEVTPVCLKQPVTLCCDGVGEVLTCSDAESFCSFEVAKSFNSSKLVLAVEVTEGDWLTTKTIGLVTFGWELLSLTTDPQASAFENCSLLLTGKD